MDCKRGDIASTQACYMLGLMGNLKDDWGVDFAAFDFDIINVTPWLGKDVMVFQDDKGGEGLGLKMMRQGKGIIGVSKSSNKSGPDYQELFVSPGTTLQLKHTDDSYQWSLDYDLEHNGLSAIGMVVGSTHACDGLIRKRFPTGTWLVPGFGAQDGKFHKIMLELIRKGAWNGLGAIFSSSRGTMYAFMKDYGGSGDPKNLEDDLINAVKKFRDNEKLAYKTPEVIEAGIEYPFAA